jgi:hypothetical protein
MNILGKYKENLKRLKKNLRKIPIKRNIYNYILLKTRKSKFDDIKILNYIDLETDIGAEIFSNIILLELSDKNIRRKRNYREKMEKRRIIRFRKEIEKMNNKVSKEEEKLLANKFNYKEINLFTNYYDKFISIFNEIDDDLSQEYNNRINRRNYMQEYYRFEHLFGLGPYLCFKYVFNNSEIKYIIENNTNSFHDDDISGIIIKGYILYKKELFNVFKAKGHFA